MKNILGFMILGMAIAYLSLFLGTFGLILLGGAAFGLLLYIAIAVSKNNK
ncbi:hypothetical protein ACFSTH_17000 [Paenibacillus yanchengensis]|uniref:Uncharacterized protein n=1 Tax=Paenibacillus yanchengensis TaxID=2035833 RepID=A0ABW4YQ86_9BACL